MNTYRLVSMVPEDRRGRGFVVERIADGQKLRWQTLPKRSGLLSVQVVGERFRLDDLQSEAFAAGMPLRLVREPDNQFDPNAIKVMDALGTLHVGYVPKEDAVRLARRLDARVALRCYAMWEVVDEGRRVELRILLVFEGAGLALPTDPNDPIPFREPRQPKRPPIVEGPTAKRGCCLGVLAMAGVFIAAGILALT